MSGADEWLKRKQAKKKRHIFSLFLYIYICSSVNDMTCFKTVSICCYTKRVLFSQTKLKPLSLYILFEMIILNCYHLKLKSTLCEDKSVKETI